MKKGIVLGVASVFLFLANAWSSPDPYTVKCSEIESASYSGNSPNATFTVTLKVKNGLLLQKYFHAPDGLHNASTFIKDLNRCDRLEAFLLRGTQGTADITTFSVVFEKKQE